MNLLIDVGNSSVKYLFHQDETLSDMTRVNSKQMNEYYFNQHWQNAKQIVIASVGKAKIVMDIIQWAAGKQIKCYQVKTEQQRFSVTIGYEVAEQFGVDRWLALLGTSNRFPNRSSLIIDAGTATTVDLLTAKGQHMGGWILPGFETMTTSLLTKTSNIQLTAENEATLLFANNTNNNVINGCLAATIGAIELAVNKAQQKLERLDQVILTGGNANLLHSHLSVKVQFCEKLVFHGLKNYLK